MLSHTSTKLSFFFFFFLARSTKAVIGAVVVAIELVVVRLSIVSRQCAGQS